MRPTTALNSMWMWNCSREKSAFDHALKNVAATQASLLNEIITQGAGSAYGRQHQFDRIRTPHDFQRRVPVTEYQDYASYVDRIAKGEHNVLTSSRVRMLEPTSGTTSAEKLIPYTDSLKKQFQSAIDVWIADLFRKRPAIRRGRAFWSISPAGTITRRSDGGVPIGFESDLEYLGAIEKHVAAALLAVPQSVCRIADIDRFRYHTLIYLVLANDLSLISVWSPTYLSVLMQSLETWSDRICFDLRNDTLSDHGNDSGQRLTRRFRLPRWGNRRADEITSILRCDSPISEKLIRLWPRLSLISCWTDAGAASYVSEIRSLFPGIEIQPKGLLATEGFVSIPLIGHPAPALAVRSHFLEFIEHNATETDSADNTDCLLAHELQIGRKYVVLLTTGGGLYRYRLHDIVEVVGFTRQCPLIRFVGKSNLVSDTVGEKLSEPHVRQVLSSALAENELTTQFSLLTPIAHPQPRYRLYLQSDRTDVATVRSLRDSVQRGLEENLYYRHAIEMRQLAPLEICVLDSESESATRLFQSVCVGRGQKVGDIKCTALDTGTEWAAAFEPLTLYTCRD